MGWLKAPYECPDCGHMLRIPKNRGSVTWKRPCTECGSDMLLHGVDYTEENDGDER